MNHDIESFLHIMQQMLPYDIIKHIVGLVSIDKNMSIIKQQKQFKINLNNDVIRLFNTYYYDNNLILYRNAANQFILQNMCMNKNIHVSSNRLSYTFTENQMVLFEQSHENDSQRRIRLDVLYIS